MSTFLPGATLGAGEIKVNTSHLLSAGAASAAGRITDISGRMEPTTLPHKGLGKRRDEDLEDHSGWWCGPTGGTGEQGLDETFLSHRGEETTDLGNSRRRKCNQLSFSE